MIGARAAAAADDLGAGVKGDAGVVRHQFRRAGIVDVAILILRDAAIALGNHGGIGPRFGNAEHGGDEFRGADTAIGTNRHRLGCQLSGQCAKRLGRDAEHGTAVGVETHCGHNGQASGGRTFDRRLQFFLRRHGLDPQHIGTPLFQGRRLFGEGLDRVLVAHAADRFHDFARWTNRSTDIDGPVHRIGFGAGIVGGGHVDFTYPSLGIVQLQAVAVAAKGVGQHNVGACLDEAAVQRAHAVGVFEIPHFRGITGLKPHLEVIGAGGAIGQQPRAGGQCFGKTGVGHGNLARQYKEVFI